jgi:hypothetical protein
MLCTCIRRWGASLSTVLQAAICASINHHNRESRDRIRPLDIDNQTSIRYHERSQLHANNFEVDPSGYIEAEDAANRKLELVTPAACNISLEI